MSHQWWPHAAKCYVHARNAAPPSPGARTPWEERFGESFHGPLCPFGCMVVYRLPNPYKSKQKFAPRGRKKIFLSYFLIPGNVWKGDCMIADFEKMIKNIDGKVRAYRVKEAPLPPQGIMFPLRETRDRPQAQQAEDAVESGVVDETYDVEIAAGDDDIEVEEIEDCRLLEAIQGLVQQAASSTDLMRVPRRSRIFIPRVGPPPPPPPPPKVNYSNEAYQVRGGEPEEGRLAGSPALRAVQEGHDSRRSDVQGSGPRSHQVRPEQGLRGSRPCLPSWSSL